MLGDPTTVESRRTRALADARIEARVTRAQKAQLQKAADLAGTTLSEFVMASARDAAHALLQEAKTLRLSRAAQVAFVTALTCPTKPNARLRKAAALYRERMGV